VPSFLVILNDRKAVAWVIKEERMAFPSTRTSQADRLSPGDRLFIYTTRGCFGSPTNDRGRVIGLAHVASKPRRLPNTLVIAERGYTSVVDLDLVGLAPFRTGVELHTLVDHLAVFPKKHAWSAVLRTTLLALPPSDAKLLTRHLDRVAESPEQTRAGYALRTR
jgi:hypothetical protein